MAGPAAIEIELTNEERAELKRWTRRRTTAQALATRAKIVLAAADGLNNAEICVKLGVRRPTVQTWRKRFAERGLEGLDDEPRSGRPRSISDERVHEIVTRMLGYRQVLGSSTAWGASSRPAKAGRFYFTAGAGRVKTDGSRKWRPEQDLRRRAAAGRLSVLVACIGRPTATLGVPVRLSPDPLKLSVTLG